MWIYLYLFALEQKENFYTQDNVIVSKSMGQKFFQSWIENSFLNSTMPRSRFKNVIKQSIDFKLFQIKVLLDPGSNLKIVSSCLLCCKKILIL